MTIVIFIESFFFALKKNRYTHHCSSHCECLAINLRRYLAVWNLLDPWDTKKFMHKKKFQKSTVCHWCCRGSKFKLNISYVNFIRSTLIFYQAGRVTKSKSSTYCLFESVPRFTGMVWGVYWRIFASKNFQFKNRNNFIIKFHLRFQLLRLKSLGF